MSEDWQTFCAGAPSRFYAKVSILLETMEPPCPLTGLSEEIWQKFEAHKQTRESLVNKMFLWMQLRRCIKNDFPDYGLFAAGSTLNGFGLKSSDIDFSFVSKNLTANKEISLNTLTKLLATLTREYETIKECQIIPATVPVLKFKDTQYDLSVDINCSNIANIRNTYLLYCYSKVDWRVKPLAVVIKLWAKRHNIIDSKYRALSSYPLILMLINFLQRGVSPPVLPSLQHVLKDKFKRDLDIEKLDFFEKLDVPFVARNRQTLAQLLCDFFLYYSSFDYQKNVISVRRGVAVSLLQYKLESSHDVSSYSKGYILIEEPFHLGNVGMSVRKLADFEKIKHVFRLSHAKLQSDESLDNIFNVCFG